MLSTHTGGFTGYTVRDLTDDLSPIAAHWNTLGLTFDAAYTGYLGSFEQIGIVSAILQDMHTKGALVICDPVMADNGKLYPAFPDNFPDGMRSLCEQADVILPNLTEACLMLGIEYKPGGQTKEYVERVLRELAKLPRKTAVLTGVSFEDSKLGAAAIDVATGEINYTMTERVPHMYHGTGDVFASAFTAAHVAGKASGDALAIAARFTADAVARTLAAGTDDRFGVNFEAGLLSLAQAAAE